MMFSKKVEKEGSFKNSVKRERAWGSRYVLVLVYRLLLLEKGIHSIPVMIQSQSNPVTVTNGAVPCTDRTTPYTTIRTHTLGE